MPRWIPEMELFVDEFRATQFKIFMKRLMFGNEIHAFGIVATTTINIIITLKLLEAILGNVHRTNNKNYHIVGSNRIVRGSGTVPVCNNECERFLIWTKGKMVIQHHHIDLDCIIDPKKCSSWPINVEIQKWFTEEARYEIKMAFAIWTTNHLELPSELRKIIIERLLC